ncbi:MAG: lanthionine synthetase LanC family protein [Planctomycetota bacterium]
MFASCADLELPLVVSDAPSSADRRAHPYGVAMNGSDRSGGGRAAAFCFVVLVGAAGGRAQAPNPAPRPDLDLAMAAAEWLRGCAMDTEHGVAWAADPDGAADADITLYHGSPGVVLFLLELYATLTLDPERSADAAAWLALAGRGADHLASCVPAVGDAVDASLYGGIAGLGFTLAEAHRFTRSEAHLGAARACVARLHESARERGAGVDWNDVNDIIAGTAGTGLFLLYTAARLEDDDALDLARRAGRRLIELAEPRGDDGLDWPMARGLERRYPNFSHGTAGVCFFLARLHQVTGDAECLATAEAGARYLASLTRDGLVPHHLPGGEELFYLGWCHGPAGTARLYDLLAELGDSEPWATRSTRAVSAVLDSGIPAARVPGLWNTVGQCCGTAGVGEMLLARAAATSTRGDALDVAAGLAEDLRERATHDERGARWPQAEHRVRPDLIVAQTGYMQGAAGVGIFLLHLDGARRGRRPAIVLPDGGTD